MEELRREAYGVRPACWRCRKAWGGSKTGASSTHSKRFAQSGYGLAASLVAQIARTVGVSLLALHAAGTDLSAASERASPQAASPLTHEAYVWQRAWTESVHAAIEQHASRFSGLTVLGAEVSWNGKQPQVIRVPLDYSGLTNVPCPVGLAFRIGPCPAALATNVATTDFLADVAASLVAEARSRHLAPRELQIDFDCAASKLDSYRAWVEVFRQRVAPLPVTITALPSWLGQPGFKRLVATADGYVLQVHSLQRPHGPDAPFTLCDPAAARRAVERAGRVGVPFRVALPTYGYLTAFNGEGRLIGLSAEGPSKTWPANVRLREVHADPVEMAGLVQLWATNRPAALRGVIWYRLPVVDDTLNWRWPTLDAIMGGRFPRESFQAEPRRVEHGLVEISLVNNGELDISSRLAVRVRWQNARLVAGDGLRGFEWVDGGGSAVTFQSRNEPCRLPAGETQVIGWLRLSEDREVQIEMERR